MNSWNIIFLSQLVSLLAGLSNVKDSFNSCRKMSNELQQFETLMGLLMDVNNEVRTQAEVYELFKIKRWLIILFCILRFCVTKGTLLKPILQWLGAYTWSISSKLSLPKVTAVSCSREKYEVDLRRKSALKTTELITPFTLIFFSLKVCIKENLSNLHMHHMHPQLMLKVIRSELMLSCMHTEKVLLRSFGLVNSTLAIYWETAK